MIKEDMIHAFSKLPVPLWKVVVPDNAKKEARDWSTPGYVGIWCGGATDWPFQSESTSLVSSDICIIFSLLDVFKAVLVAVKMPWR